MSMGQRYEVYELVNADLNEILVGIGAKPPSDVARMAEELAPPRWSPSHHLKLRVVETALSMEDAALFAAQYVDSEAMRPLKVYLGAKDG